MEHGWYRKFNSLLKRSITFPNGRKEIRRTITEALQSFTKFLQPQNKGNEFDPPQLLLNV